MMLALAAAAAQAAAPSAADAFGALEHAYVVFCMGRFPVVGTYLGGAAFDPSLADVDGRLRDYSAGALAAEDARLAQFRAQFAALEPTTLAPQARIDRAVALAQIDFLLHQHQVLKQQLRALDSYVDEPTRGVDWQIQGMTPTGTATRGTASEWRQVIARARAVPAYLSTAEQQLSAGVRAGIAPDYRVLLDFGLGSSAADAEYFGKTLPQIAADSFTGAERAQLLRELADAGRAAANAYKHLHDFVATTFFDDPNGRDVGALKPGYRADRFALGEREYDWALRHNLRVEHTASELYEGSWPRVEATRASMIALARSIAASQHWSVPADGDAATLAVLERVSRDAPRDDTQMIQAYRRTGVRLVEYARRTHLFDVPADYQLEVTETPPPLRASIDGAAYYPAPVFKMTGIGRFYVTPTGDDQEQLQQVHNFAAMPDLAAHEGFPGHDWNYRVMAQYRAQISPIRWLTPGAVEDSLSMWEDSMSSEGWALYSEALLAEPQPGAPNGFYTPAEHLYQLQGALYRELRVRIDTGIHTARMSFEDAVTLYSEVVDFLPGSCTDAHALQQPAKRASCEQARTAVTRYARWPTQAITYGLGKDEILALRTRARAQLGARFSLQRFHLEFMKQGTIPPGYFAEELLRALQNQ
jgi:uncharacterized protein (DUF885 family)